MAIKKIKLPDNTTKDINDAREVAYISDDSIGLLDTDQGNIIGMIAVSDGRTAAFPGCETGDEDYTLETVNGAASKYLPLSGGTLTGDLTAPKFIKTGGTSSQFLKADGSVDSSVYLTTTTAANTYLPLAGGTMANTNKVTNLNADLLDGLNSTDFTQKFSYTLGTASAVDISFTAVYHAIIIARNTNNNEPLILIGGGYGDTSIRNRFKQISTTTSTPIHWRYLSGEGVQIINNGLSNASVSVLVTKGTAPTFTAATFDIETGFEDYALEITSNKVTSLSSSSTDTQYPSAKCVYDLLGDVESLILAL